MGEVGKEGEMGEAGSSETMKEIVGEMILR
jgi:hypothetical protein